MAGAKLDDPFVGLLPGSSHRDTSLPGDTRVRDLTPGALGLWLAATISGGESTEEHPELAPFAGSGESVALTSVSGVEL